MWSTRGPDDERLTSDGISELRMVCADAPFISMHVSPTLWQWNPARLRAEIDLAGTLGAVTLVVHRETLGLVDATSRPDIPEIRRLCTRAQGHGVRLALENGFDSMWALDLILDTVGDNPDKTNLGICIDVGHAHISHDAGRQPIRNYLERYRGSLIHLHLHDNGGTTDDHLPPGAGTIDWRAVLETVNRIGYSGPGILEIHTRDDPAHIIATARAYLDACQHE